MNTQIISFSACYAVLLCSYTDDTTDSLQQTAAYKQALKPPSGPNTPNCSPRSPKKGLSPTPNSLDGNDTKFAFKPTVDTANLTIKERIALMQGKNIGTGTSQPSAVKPPLAKKPESFRKSEGLGRGPGKDPPHITSTLIKAPNEEQNRIPEGLGRVPLKDPPQIDSTRSNKTPKEELTHTHDGPKSWISAVHGQNAGKITSVKKV